MPRLNPQLLDLCYLAAAILFIFGLKMLASPKTARRGNLLAAFGMLVAIVVTLFDQHVLDFTRIAIGLILGTVLGAFLARFVQMTQMPQLVALFNGFGGIASTFVACSEYFRLRHDIEPDSQALMLSMFLSLLIGTLTFTGSMIAAGKLHGLVTGRPVTYTLQKTSNAALLIVAATLGWYMVAHPEQWWIPLLVIVIAGGLGVTSVIPIGGADMPVVISLLNSYSGLAAAATGFVLDNKALIIAGALVGASGMILTMLMCRAMNRSLANVLFGAFGTGDLAPGAAPTAAKGSVKQGSPDDAAIILDSAQSVLVVPGYGLAVAQAQHVVREMAERLEKRGCKVQYAIHPVAGRMPGHMNVLLAEANVPYEQLLDLDRANPEFETADVALVVGANDVTNPAARHDKASPIYGMPILDVDKARTIMFLKRSMNPGFAGIENELFYHDRCMMIFGDAKKTLTEIVEALKGM
jgi:NAD(P) transhydrogenase subunit beta